jgi:hypothetical protein
MPIEGITASGETGEGGHDREAESEARPAVEAEAGWAYGEGSTATYGEVAPPPYDEPALPSHEEAAPAPNRSEEAPRAASPSVGEPTREWTLGEGDLDPRAREERIPRGHVPPRTRGSRWSPRTDDEASGDERSLKELFWGED